MYFVSVFILCVFESGLSFVMDAIVGSANPDSLREMLCVVVVVVVVLLLLWLIFEEKNYRYHSNKHHSSQA